MQNFQVEIKLVSTALAGLIYRDNYVGYYKNIKYELKNSWKYLQRAKKNPTPFCRKKTFF